MIANHNSCNEPELVREVLGYFVEHPGTVDTLEGVARWRLTEKRVRQTVTRVSESLQWLVSREFLTATHQTGLEPVYRLNVERIKEAAKFMIGQESIE
jgi:hypothetical protein